MPQGLFFNLDAATLATMQADWLACFHSISIGHQSYSLAGRTFTRANLEEVSKVLSEISSALEYKRGNLVRKVYADMSNST